MHLGLVGARERGVRSFLDLDPVAKRGLADRIQIQQVIVSLMRNAVEPRGPAKFATGRSRQSAKGARSGSPSPEPAPESTVL